MAVPWKTFPDMQPVCPPGPASTLLLRPFLAQPPRAKSAPARYRGDDGSGKARFRPKGGAHGPGHKLNPPADAEEGQGAPDGPLDRANVEPVGVPRRQVVGGPKGIPGSPPRTPLRVRPFCASGAAPTPRTGTESGIPIAQGPPGRPWPGKNSAPRRTWASPFPPGFQEPIRTVDPARPPPGPFSPPRAPLPGPQPLVPCHWPSAGLADVTGPPSPPTANVAPGGGGGTLGAG